MKSKSDSLFLHIGLPKTGTTHLQRMIHKNRSILESDNMYYPGHEFNHFSFFASFLPDGKDALPIRRRVDGFRDDYDVRTRDARREVVEASENGRTLIISSEYFTRLKLPSIRLVKSFVDEVACSTKVICYVRHPLASAVSAAQQNVKTGWKTLEEVDNDPPWVKFRRTLKGYSDCFGDRLVIRVYENMVDRDIVSDFFHILGKSDVSERFEPYADASPKGKALQNVSLTMAGAWLASQRSADSKPLFSRKQIFAAGGDRFHLTEDSIAKVEEESASDLKWLRRKFGITLPRPELVSRRPLDTYFNDPTLQKLRRKALRR